MTRKTIVATSVIGLLAFLLGWFLHCIIIHPTQTSDTKQISSSADTIHNADTIKKPGDFSNTISGRFVLEESNCAGLDFIDKTIVLWTNEIACNDPDTLKIRWLDSTSFMTKSTRRINENCPPGIDIYKVISFDGKHLVLRSIWTGWNESKDDILKFAKQSK